MLILKILGIVLASLVAVFVIGGLVLPSGYHVERSVVIEAPTDAVHAYVGELRQWDAWTPWKEIDPTIEVSFGDRTTGVGAHQSWTGESGSGELTFTVCSLDQGVSYDMSFDEGKYLSVGSLRYEAVDGGTQVVWIMDGDSGKNLAARWFGAFMDQMVGKDFEKGLSNLKQVVEAEA